MIGDIDSDEIFDPDDVWWRRTWKEREDALKGFFGETEPPGFVTSFSWKNEDLVIPGACALTFPPVPSRAHYTHLTLGQTQPIARHLSAQDFEFGLYSQTNTSWEKQLLFDLMTDFSEKKEKVERGTWYPLSFFSDRNGQLACGLVKEPVNERIGKLTGLYLWPDPSIPSFHTSTGLFKIMNVIGVTSDEDELAVKTSPPHLILFLKRLGLGMLNTPFRTSALSLSNGVRVWKEIEGLHHDKVISLLETI